MLIRSSPQRPCSARGKDGDLGTLTGAWLSAPDAVKDCRGRVLVHCQAGISRSATICLAYLMMKKRVRLEEAFEFVKQRRSIISPNFSFMGQLLDFERSLQLEERRARERGSGGQESAASDPPSFFTTPTSDGVFELDAT